MKRRKANLNPRKVPRQDRSRATVDAILQAATYILEQGGWSSVTTNRVAARAGVNVASVYQYFSGKAAILAELQRRHTAECNRAMMEALQTEPHSGGESKLKTLVRAGIASHLVNPRLHQVLSEEAPQATESLERLLGDRLLAAMRDLLQSLQPDGAEPELAFWMAITASHAIAHRGVRERMADVVSGRLADELESMLLGYFRHPR